MKRHDQTMFHFCTETRTGKGIVFTHGNHLRGRTYPANTWYEVCPEEQDAAQEGDQSDVQVDDDNVWLK